MSKKNHKPTYKQEKKRKPKRASKPVTDSKLLGYSASRGNMLGQFALMQMLLGDNKERANND